MVKYTTTSWTNQVGNFTMTENFKIDFCLPELSAKMIQQGNFK